MDFGFLGYMGIMALCLFCCPPIFTIIAVGITYALNKNKVISVSNQKILVIGIIFFIVSLIITCVFVEIVSNGVYAM